MEPLLSVIIPVYNSQKYLTECLESVLRQSYKNIEVILINDGSSDDSGKLCDEFLRKDDRIKVIHKQNEGQAIARNIGIECAKGEYITFIDSDDWIGENYIETFMKHCPFDILYGGCTYVSEKGTERVCISKERIANKINIEDDIWEELVKKSLLGYACAKVYKKDIIRNIRYGQFLFREDLIFNIKVLNNAEKMGILTNSEYYYRQHEESTLHKKYQGQIPEISPVCMLMEKYIPCNDEQKRRALINTSIKVYITDIIAKCIIRHRDLNEAEKINEIKKIFKNKGVKNTLSFYRNELRILQFFTICYKMNLPIIYYLIMRKKYNE